MNTSWENSRLCRRTMLACSLLSLIVNLGLHASLLGLFDHVPRPGWLSASQANADRLRHCDRMAHTTGREACVAPLVASMPHDSSGVQLASGSVQKP